VRCADLAGVGDRMRTDQCADRLRSSPDLS